MYADFRGYPLPAFQAFAASNIRQGLIKPTHGTVVVITLDDRTQLPSLLH